jgi:TolB-like protein/DNA-binding winged helix-turn-helix (wHTH) protein/Tfp pilus assembly protein PilF
MPGDPVLHFGPYRLEVSNEQLWRDTQLVRLTPKALQVLCMLAEHSGQLVTKEELFQVVWSETVVSDAALTSCIQELRQALGDNARSPRYIETVHRRGFRFLLAITTQPVQGSTFKVQKEDESQKAKDENGLESSVQSLESNGQSPASRVQSLASEEQRPTVTDQTLDTRLSDPGRQTLDISVLPRFWRRRSLILASVLLFAGIAVTGWYWLRPLTLRTQPSELGIEEVTPPLPLLDKPSIIVLPFTNLSGDPSQEYFSDGLTEVLTTDLSKIASLFVIARNSAFTYKSKAAKVQDVSKEMGVRYVLEGSVLRADGQVRITAQLIDATTGYHLWSERYDRPLKDIFAVQDEIVRKIVTTLELQLSLQEQGFIARKRTDNPDAYDAWMQGLASFVRSTKETNGQARQMFEKAVALDPEYAGAYANLGWTYWIEWVYQWNPDPQNLERATELAQKAIALDDSLPAAHGLLSLIYVRKHQFEQALAEGERAIALDPNFANAYAWQVETLIHSGRPADALEMAKKAIRLNPRYPLLYAYYLGFAYRMTGQYEEAIAAQKEAILRNPNFFWSSTELANSYLDAWWAQQLHDPQILERALEAAQRAVALNGSSPVTLSYLSLAYLSKKQYEQATAEAERMLALKLPAADVCGCAASALSLLGRSEEALELIGQALRPPGLRWYLLSFLGQVYYLAGKPEEAITPLKQYLARYPNILGAHLNLAAVYSELGKETEARAEVAEVLRLNPTFSLEVHKERAPIKDPAALERHLAALRKAGL